MINKLKEMREAKTITQEELANKVGVTARTIISLEKGQYKPSIMLAYKLSLFFELTIEELFMLKENLEELK
ncbi:TPA: helix-turn-helix transcriptional regulator [Streptococcus suis]|uniref:helix-turn-helix transcriptional regulator n=1 Tax=Streptococcus suis TaxID=1307 RepID=UPI0005CC9317|nr:helix-turn-helix transcriptional regulator [Streptococcus suis]NQR01233.1 helix-turn-helix transcriptional regulator [Streptococcus suis]NQR72788.1 helix-turn-helix transcriptional regulator [Streptococcus suis]NQS32928.1 helix-turn-helix transcriptional regulator [Streptococcus suis]CYX27086.1 transcriptional regulator in ATPase CF(0) region [Streptococcus suis]HEM5621406.1 helix-turn-helix transcriptional regulator [Streptococcus suis]